MPEGPEVLIISEQLDFYFNNKILNSFTFLGGKYKDNPPENYNLFISSLPMKINKVFCKGKLIVFELGGDNKRWWILNSLRMTGKW